jgi:hypothetical protein
MAFAPVGNVKTASKAFPELSRFAVPREVPPLVKVTVPDGVFATPADGATIALSDTPCPNVLGLGLVVRVVVLEALFMTCARAVEAELEKLLSPL